jgi:hypothetical protein
MERPERFYRDLERRQVRVRVGIEATGHARWFERLLAELQFELWHLSDRTFDHDYYFELPLDRERDAQSSLGRTEIPPR